MRIPILYPKLEGIDFEIDPELIYMVQDITFAGREDEDPSDHLTNVHDLGDTLKPPGLSIEFALL